MSDSIAEERVPTSAGAPDLTIDAPQVTDHEAAEALARMRLVSPDADPQRYLPDVHPTRIPRHIAIIMDGNGRWARERGFPRIFGHRNGAAAVRDVIEACGNLGEEVLTLYSFSLENWKRPPEEVQALMLLYLTYLEGERERIMRENIRFIQIGRRDHLPPEVVDAVDRMTEETAANTGPTLVLAVNYGSRAEITDAVRDIAAGVRRGEIDPESVDEAMISDRLYTAGLPDPDLLIRTAGEMRVSNYLLWQISYAEIYVTQTLWPDFSRECLYEAIREYARRRRRFGGLDATVS